MTTHTRTQTLLEMCPAGCPATPRGGVATSIVPWVDLNPLQWLGDQAQQTLADGFASMMMGLWSAGVWLLQTAFSLIDSFTPNVNDPDLTSLYAITLWIALAIALVVAVGQIGVAVIRQDGRGFGTLLAGVVQYGVVVACWVGVCAGVITGTSGLADGLLRTLLGVDSFSGYAAGDGFVDTVSGTVESATLGVCALFLVIPAAFGHIIIMLVRSAALLVLTATMPIAAAGALSESTKAWMWKSIRWFLACALMQPLLALVLGLGTQFAWSGMPDGTGVDVGLHGRADAATAASAAATTAASTATASASAQNIGLSVVGSVILLVSCFTPLVLFRLLAFVDPGTASGASFRTTMSANGGVSGLLKGDRRTASAPNTHSGAASETAADGRTTSENGAEAQTANRWQAAALARASGTGGRAGAKVGSIVGSVMERTATVARIGASMGVDVLGQAGIGNQSYYDLGHNPEQSRSGHARAHRAQLPQDSHGHLHPDTSGDTHMHTHSERQGDSHREARDTSGGDHGRGSRGGMADGATPQTQIPPQAQTAVEDGAFLA